MSTRGSGTGTTAVNTSILPLLTAPGGRLLRVSALNIVVLPLFGRPIIPNRIDQLSWLIAVLSWQSIAQTTSISSYQFPTLLAENRGAPAQFILQRRQRLVAGC